MKHTSKLTFPALFHESYLKYWHKDALTYVGDKPLTYNDVKNKIDALIAFLEKNNIKNGDKIAILSANMPNWAISYFAITFMGAVAVPLLPDFKEEELEKVLKHSEAKAIFISEKLNSKFNKINVSAIQLKIQIEDFSLIGNQSHKPQFIEGELPKNNYDPAEDDLASIIYTSGTTGRPKGVMLSHKNICFTALKGKKIQEFDHQDRFLSVLPLSHTYENTLGLMIPIFSGACVYYLKKPPTASVLLPALSKVKPTAMLTVPLIMEKIYQNRILPVFYKNTFIKTLYKLPPLRKMFNKVAGKKLKQTFGGHLKFYGIGGSKIDGNVEKFLKEAKFPYAIGYGLTEASPLLAGSNPQNTAYRSTGPAMEGVELKLFKHKKHDKEGEIWAKGDNLMQGYYKDPELTKEVLTEDGWLKTGDLGVVDKNNNLYIKGRLKNVILGASGENIYPEEIESVINNFKYVLESIVVEKKGKLVALVHFNYEELEKQYMYLKEEVVSYIETKTEELKKELHEYVNRKVNNFSRIQQVIPQPIPFEKTATKKIKRFLYK